MQTELNLIKLKPGLGAFYAIQAGNELGLFYSSGVRKLEWLHFRVV